MRVVLMIVLRHFRLLLFCLACAAGGRNAGVVLPYPSGSYPVWATATRGTQGHASVLPRNFLRYRHHLLSGRPSGNSLDQQLGFL